MISAKADVKMFRENPIVGDVVATALTCIIVECTFRVWREIDKMRLLDQKHYGKLQHFSLGLVFLLCWPMFRSNNHGAVLASLIPCFGTIKLLLMVLGMWEDEAAVKYMLDLGDYRKVFKGGLCYLATLTFTCAVYWRTSPVAIATICNLCAGDGLAAIVGRRFGSQKLPYNKNKSVAGTISMVAASFIASMGYMHYFSTFGYVEESWQMVYRFFVVSLVGGLVESHPLSTQLDDNLTVPLASLLVGSCIF